MKNEPKAYIATYHFHQPAGSIVVLFLTDDIQDLNPMAEEHAANCSWNYQAVVFSEVQPITRQALDAYSKELADRNVLESSNTENQ